MKTAPSESTKPSFEKRLRRIVGLVVLSAVVLPILAFLVWRISLSIRLKSKLAAIAKAGYPVSIADLERMYYPALKPEVNNAVFFTNAFTHLAWTNTPKVMDEFWGNGWRARRTALSSAETNALLRSLLATNEDLLVLLRKAPELEQSRYPIRLEQGLDIDLPHLDKIKMCEEIVITDAAVQVYVGNSDVAVEDLKAAVELAHSLSTEPVLVSQMVRRSCHRFITVGLQQVLSESRLTERQLGQLSITLRAEENGQSVERALAGERCVGVDLHQHLVEHALADDSSDYQKWHIDTNRVSAIASGILKTIGILDANLDYYLGIMSQEVSFAKSSHPEKRTAAHQLQSRISSARTGVTHFYADLLLRDFGRLADGDARDATELSLSMTALAVERFRLAHDDRLPAQLTDLVPTFLHSVPQDPFDGQPLRFKPLEKGYVIYSIGPDLTDDGGREWQRRPKGVTNDLPYDITFIVDR